MAPKSPGTAVPVALSRLARKRWYIFKHSNAGSAQDPQISFIVGYLLAWRESIAGGASFADLPQQLARLSDLLEDTQAWQQAADGAVTENELDEEEKAQLAEFTPEEVA